jgi:hypothetical protein
MRLAVFAVFAAKYQRSISFPAGIPAFRRIARETQRSPSFTFPIAPSHRRLRFIDVDDNATLMLKSQYAIIGRCYGPAKHRPRT